MTTGFKLQIMKKENRSKPTKSQGSTGKLPGDVEVIGRHSESESARYRRPDADIFQEITSDIMEDPTLHTERIKVHVEEGEVILQGTVDSDDSRIEIEERIQEMLGVLAVRNRLSVENQHEDDTEHASWTSGSKGIQGALSRQSRDRLR